MTWNAWAVDATQERVTVVWCAGGFDLVLYADGGAFLQAGGMLLWPVASARC